MDWQGQYASIARVGSQRLEYRVSVAPIIAAMPSSPCKFYASVDAGEGPVLLGSALESLDAAWERCEENLRERNSAYHDQVIEDRTASFLRDNAIKVEIKVVREEKDAGLGAHLGKEVREEMTAYEATLERVGKKRRIQIPVWGESMPDETIVLYVAGLTAASKSDYKRFCEDNRLEPDNGRSKLLFKRLTKWEQEVRRFFTSTEIKQLHELNAPPSKSHGKQVDFGQARGAR